MIHFLTSLFIFPFISEMDQAAPLICSMYPTFGVDWIILETFFDVKFLPWKILISPNVSQNNKNKCRKLLTWWELSHQNPTESKIQKKVQGAPLYPTIFLANQGRAENFFRAGAQVIIKAKYNNEWGWIYTFFFIGFHLRPFAFDNWSSSLNE